MRGEYLGGLAGNTKFLELPPRARRIQSCQVNIPFGNGTTSACAENTEWCVMHIENERNYLRVRGEYILSPPSVMLTTELPPRARRIRGLAVCALRRRGTTSACAENTAPPRQSFHKSWNYLRVRGEYGGTLETLLLGKELPPRARRIPPMPPSMRREPRNYLRVRGEYVQEARTILNRGELPPRARRIP